MEESEISKGDMLGSSSVILPPVWPQSVLDEISKNLNWKFVYNPKDPMVFFQKYHYCFLIFPFCLHQKINMQDIKFDPLNIQKHINFIKKVKLLIGQPKRHVIFLRI